MEKQNTANGNKNPQFSVFYAMSKQMKGALPSRLENRVFASMDETQKELVLSFSKEQAAPEKV